MGTLNASVSVPLPWVECEGKKVCGTNVVSFRTAQEAVVQWKLVLMGRVGVFSSAHRSKGARPSLPDPSLSSFLA